MAGFIAIERDLWDHPVFAPSAMSEREAWMWMLARAAYAGTKHRVGADVVEVSRGSFMATLREMQSAFMWQSDKKVRNFLKKLENHGMIAVLSVGQRNARKTHVTVCNYDEYQSRGRSKDAAKTHDGRSADAVKKQGNKGTISLPIGSDADDQVSFADQLWDRGVKFLMAHGSAEPQARSVIGKWINTYPAEEVFEAFRACRREEVVAPIPWITARLKPPSAGFTPVYDPSKFEDQA